jgi:hypothetical protein
LPANPPKALKRLIFFLQTTLNGLRIRWLLTGENTSPGFSKNFSFSPIILYPNKSELKPTHAFFVIHFHAGGNVVCSHPFPGYDFMVANFWIAVESTRKNVVEFVFNKS